MSLAHDEPSEGGLPCGFCEASHPEDMLRCPRTMRILDASRLFQPGNIVAGKFRVEGILGSGAMGVVLEATHLLLARRVALKVMLPDVVGKRELVARFVREARIAGSTGHPNICQVSDMGWTPEGGVYLVLELLSGATLGALLARQGRFKVGTAIAIINDVLLGLSAVHAKGVVHRDLKPENLMVAHGERGDIVKILDFGISKVIAPEASLQLTQPGAILGTTRYMAPEQARGEDVDTRADLYAVGVVLYRLLAGRGPSTAKSLELWVAEVLSGARKPPSRWAPGLPPELDRIVLKALAVEREDRFANADAFRAALRPYLCSGPLRILESATQEAQEGVRGPGADGLLAPVDLDEGVEPADVLESRILPGCVAGEHHGESKAGPVAEPDPGGQSAPSPPIPGGATAPNDVPEDSKGDSFVLDVEQPGARVPLYSPMGDLANDTPLAEGEQRKTHGRKGSGRPWLGALAVVIVLVALGVGSVYLARHEIWRSGGKSNTTEFVLLLVEVKPTSARIWVDGVEQETSSIRIPRGERAYQLRIAAKGFRTKRLAVDGMKTRAIRVRLKRR